MYYYITKQQLEPRWTLDSHAIACLAQKKYLIANSDTVGTVMNIAINIAINIYYVWSQLIYTYMYLYIYIIRAVKTNMISLPCPLVRAGSN